MLDFLLEEVIRDLLGVTYNQMEPEDLQVDDVRVCATLSTQVMNLARMTYTIHGSFLESVYR